MCEEAMARRVSSYCCVVLLRRVAALWLPAQSLSSSASSSSCFPSDSATLGPLLREDDDEDFEGDVYDEAGMAPPLPMPETPLPLAPLSRRIWRMGALASKPDTDAAGAEAPRARVAAAAVWCVCRAGGGGEN